jgi:hypothetical protein
MMCIPKSKKNPNLRTVVDSRKRNANTVRDVTPLPDQDGIRTDVARARFRSKIDLSDAYEQIRVEPADVWKTAFATVYGTMVSHVMQQGDCNAPATFQRLMTHLFREYISLFVHVFLDDIFVFSNTIDEHEEHLGLVFKALRNASLYLNKEKCSLYAQRVECLGHIIDDEGIHICPGKMELIRDWRTPRNVNEVQRFLGLVQYLAQFMPDLSAYTGPLSVLSSEARYFHWRPLHDKCFEMIKALAYRTPILRPIDPGLDEPIWLVCDASVSGVGAMYGQGKDWRTCRPAGFMSRKFSPAQFSYKTWDREALAIVQGFMRWEDKLLGRRVRVVTDHEALGFFKNQQRLTGRQTRWMEFLERFDYTIEYVKGETNKVADCLSRYYQSDEGEESHPKHVYVDVDVILDPEGDDLPNGRVEEFRAARAKSGRRKRALREATEERVREAQDLAATTAKKEEPSQMFLEGDLSLKEALLTTKPTAPLIEGTSGLLDSVRKGYEDDPLFSKILAEPGSFRGFANKDGILISRNYLGEEVVCVPRTMHGKRSLPEIIIEGCHLILGHFGARKTIEYIRRFYWWPSLTKDTEKYCVSCGVCQTIKSSPLRPQGLLHTLPIPTRPWESVGMDFVGPFPQSKGFDYLWVVICRLTSMVHLIPIKVTIKASELAWLYFTQIVRLHGIPRSIVSDRDPKFTSAFWRELHRLLGTKLAMSTAFHPQTDGASERAIRSISQILRSVVSADQTDWAEKVAMVEFAINSSISSSTGFAPFELNYGYLPRISTELLGQKGKAPRGVQDLVDQAAANLMAAHDAIIASRVTQTAQANKRRRAEEPFSEGEEVYLSTGNLNLPKGRARKLLPKFIGPYRIAKAFPESSTYKLVLPDSLKGRRIHPVFHASRLRRHEKNDDGLFPHREVKVFYDFGDDADDEWLVDSISGHRWVGKKVDFEVRWSLGDTTWEPYESVRKLEALDDYFALQGVRTWQALPKRPAGAARAQSSDRAAARE